MTKKQKIFIGIFIFFLILFFLIVFRKAFVKVLSLLVMATIEAFLIFPFIKVLEKRMPRSFAIILGFIIFSVCFCSVVMLFIPIFLSQIKNLLELLPQYINDIKILFNKIPFFSALFNNLSLNENILNKMSEILSLFAPSKLVSLITSTFLVPVIVYYIIKERERLKEISLFFLPGKMRTPAIYICRDINRQLRDYVLGELIIIFAISFIMSATLGVFGFKYWMLLGIMMGLFNVIPYIGPVLGSIPILFTALLQNKLIIALILILLVQQIDNLIIHPRIISDSVKIHPVIVLLCVIAGNSIGNMLGMVLAIPLFIILRILFKNFYRYFIEIKNNFTQFSKI